MKTQLIDGKTVTVSDEDLDLLIAYKWGIASTRTSAYLRRYTTISGKKTHIILHRVIAHRMGLITNTDTKTDPTRIDHIDNNTMNNSRSNLRKATAQQNAANAFKSRGDFSSPYKGTYYDSYRKKWRAATTFDGKTINLGRFDTPEQAARAYDKKVKELHGTYARLNFPDEYNTSTQ